ncbi:Serine/threonine-protein kinase DCLK1 [Labeo rohita]|uniref:Serine/threonine-protein kinase DCLK1 n=1 Tax=Labeo rohita TaxID=84645 RepID=A0ABQ8MCT5_LABRO|nr:Serine/threonine-protein kinase DCLK1 [Labeo rohita]
MSEQRLTLCTPLCCPLLHSLESALSECCCFLPPGIALCLKMLQYEVNGTPASQMSTPHSAKSPSPTPTSPGSLKKRRNENLGQSDLPKAETHLSVFTTISCIMRVGVLTRRDPSTVSSRQMCASFAPLAAPPRSVRGRCSTPLPSNQIHLSSGRAQCSWRHHSNYSPRGPERGSQHSGSSLSLASTKVCSMDEEEGPVSDAEPLEETPIPTVPSSISDRYKVGRMIGDGNFAVVHECVEHSTGRAYALKIINKGKCRGKEMDTYSELYLVMELVKYLHSLNIVHRDIKPENLLVYEHQDGSKSLKLGDFGLATVVDGPLYTVCGTPTYVAPEIIAETGYGLKVDIWAAGVITYILLCGFPPFRGSTDDQEALFDQILLGQLEFPLPYWDNVSDSAKELIVSMLQVEVDQRYTALQVLEHPWVTNDGLSENEHQLSVAGKIKKHFNTGPKPSNNTPGVSVMTTTALDKERQILRRGCHQNVSAAPWTTQPTCSLHIPAFTPSLCPGLHLDPLSQPPSGLPAPALIPGPNPSTTTATATTTPESEDFSACSTETVRSLFSPF